MTEQYSVLRRPISWILVSGHPTYIIDRQPAFMFPGDIVDSLPSVNPDLKRNDIFTGSRGLSGIPYSARADDQTLLLKLRNHGTDLKDRNSKCIFRPAVPS